jgi:hypothetical protein
MVDWRIRFLSRPTGRYSTLAFGRVVWITQSEVARDEGRTHVDAHRDNGVGIATTCGEIIAQYREGLGILAFGDKHDPS